MLAAVGRRVLGRLNEPSSQPEKCPGQPIPTSPPNGQRRRARGRGWLAVLMRCDWVANARLAQPNGTLVHLSLGRLARHLRATTFERSGHCNLRDRVYLAAQRQRYFAGIDRYFAYLVPKSV